MKKRFLALLLSVVCALCVFGLSACDNGNRTPETGSGTGGDTEAGHVHAYVWVDNGNGTHSRHCSASGCPDPDIDTGAHEWGADGKCTKCGAVAPSDAHIHNYVWVDNGDGTHSRHCSASGCPDPDIDTGAHEWGADGKCTKCGADKPAPTQVATLTYELSDDGNAYSVTGIVKGTGTDVEIPASYQNKPVTEIANLAFWPDSADPDAVQITSVTIPDSVTKIGDYAFYATLNLKSIVIPSSVTELGNQILRYSGVKVAQFECAEVPKSAFWSNTALEKVILGSGVKTISDYAFYESSIKEIVISEGLESIGPYAFYKSTIENINIPDSVTVLGNYAFYGCASLKSAKVGNGVITLPQYAFANCTALSGVELGANIQTIEKIAFYNTGLTYVELPSGLTTIGNQAFEYAPLTEITIPESVTSIGNYAFELCRKLKKVYWNAAACKVNADAFMYNEALTCVILGESVTSVYTSTFAKCYSIAEVVNKSGLTLAKGNNSNGYVAKYAINILSDESESTLLTVGNYEFCKNIENDEWHLITTHADLYSGAIDKVINDLPASVNGSTYKISSYAFNNISRLTEVVIPSGVTEIETYAFMQCRHLHRVTIGADVQSIGTNAFYGCDRMTEICNLSSVEYPVAYSYVAASVINLYSESSANYLIKSGDYMFSRNADTGEYYLTDYLGSETDITLPQSINGQNYKVANYAFGDCTTLVGITIPRGVTGFGKNAFMTRQLVYGSVAQLGCKYLKTVRYEGTLEDWCKITFDGYYSNPLVYPNGEEFIVNGQALTAVVIPSAITEINAFAFCGCEAMTSLTLHSNIKSIGENAFAACTNITEVEIPASVTVLDPGAFTDCTSLTKATIKSTSIKYMTRTFNGCTSLTDIRYSGTTAQWEAISKSNWIPSSANYTVTCSNGNVTP